MSDAMTGQQLITAARAAGYREADDDLLKRFRRGGLIRRPTRTGSEQLYPPGTLAQLVAALELHGTFRVLRRVRFELWWSGRWADSDQIRQDLASELDKTMAPLRALRESYPDPFDAADVALSHTDRRLSPTLRAMRRLAKGDENLQSAMHALVVLVMGGEPAWEPSGAGPDDEEAASLGDIVNLASGITRGAADGIEGVGPLYDASVSMPETLTNLRDNGLLALDNLGEPLLRATDEQLERARSHATAIVDSLAGLSLLAAARFGRDFAGLSPLHGLADADPAGRAWITLLCLRLSDVIPPEEQSVVAENLAAFQAEKVRSRCITKFMTHYPGYRYIFSTKPRDKARVAAMTQDERELLSTQITTFLRDNPECTDALGR